MGPGTREWEEGAVDGVTIKKVREGDSPVDAELDIMPGILPRQESTSKTYTAAKMANDTRHGTHVDGYNRESNNVEYRNGNVLTNGNVDYANGGHVNGISATPLPSPPCEDSGAIVQLAGQLPPEIEQITFGYTPFHLLISRLVQETFNGLAEVINDLSEIAVPPAAQHAPSSHLSQFVDRNGEASGANVQKKLRILNFTSDRRAQFIKILVLLRWAHQADAVSKVIDLNVWINRRLQDYKECISWIGEMKRMLGPLRDPNPDIKTALEVLSLGKASWLPDLGYLPPEPLSSPRLLDTLRKINTLLSIRLNLYEVIPRAFKIFSIASGRATFHVREEFEVDLSIADEDPSSQLYFIDFRFIFSPTPAELPAGRLRDEIEGRANDALKREGLQGLYDLLHNLTLTHKLSVLRNQAYELARGYWSEQLKVEAVHRSVVVQYWLNRPGGKHWIEIGLKRGREAVPSYALSGQRIPSIGLRWFRGGKEITSVRIEMRLGDLSLAFILKQIIALHTSHIFEQMAAKLRGSLLYSGGSLRLKYNVSATEPMDASLLLQLSRSKAIKVVQEPVSGRVSILPASQLNHRAEYELNRIGSAASGGAAQLTHLRSSISMEEAEMDARALGWEALRSINPNQETISRLFGKGIQHRKFFRRPSWNPSWILAFTTSLEGDSWWITELADRTKTTGSITPKVAADSTLQAAYKIPLPGLSSQGMRSSYTVLADFENIAAVMISQLVDTRALILCNYRHKVQTVRRNGSGTYLGSLTIRVPNKTASSVLSSANTEFPWLDEQVRLEYRGLDPSRGSVIHAAKVHMQHTIIDLQGLLSNIPSVAFKPATESLSEAVIFQFLTRIGETVIPSLRARLNAIGLLLSFASTLRSYNLSCNAASLTRLLFNYTSSTKPLKAAVHFPEEAPRRITLSKSNPHLRIVDYLSSQIRTKGLSPVLGNLRLTLPLLHTFSVIEAGQDSAGVDILTRSDQWYQVRYSKPFSKSSFDIRLRVRRDDAMWFVPETSMKKPETSDEIFEQNLKALAREKGDGWWGVNGGIIAHIKGVENLLVKLDALFRTSKHVVPLDLDSNSKKRKADDEIVELD